MIPAGNNDDSSLSDINIDNPANNPTDSVSSIQWMPPNAQGMKLFATSTWDGQIKLYDVNFSGYSRSISQKATFGISDPILSLSWKKDCSMIFAGCADNTVKAFDLSSGSSVQVGSHDAAVREVFWIEEMQVLMSCSFDKTVKFWQIGNQNPAFQLSLDYKIVAADLNYPLMFLGLSQEKILIVDLTSMTHYPGGKPNAGNYMESPLGSPTSCLSFFPNRDGFGIGSTDGRANLSMISKDMMNQMNFKTQNKMTFKCHKLEQNNTQILMPVHSIGFHPNSKCFVFTAGGDGVINFWDYEAKNKIKNFNMKTIPVTKAKINYEGNLMAYALGYDWHKGVWGIDGAVKPKICVHALQENELKFSGK